MRHRQILAIAVAVTPSGVVSTLANGAWGAYGVINDGGNPGERTGAGAYVPMVK